MTKYLTTDGTGWLVDFDGGGRVVTKERGERLCV